MQIEVTTMGFVVIPLTLVVLLFRRDLLLPLTVVLSVFQAASVVNFVVSGTAYGLQPGYFGAIVFLLEFQLGRALRRYQPDRAVTERANRVLAPLLVFTLWACLGAVVAPRFFLGHVSVYPPRVGLTGLTLLVPSSTNLTQCLYIVFLLLFVRAACLRVADSPELIRSVQKALHVAAVTIIGTGAYQLLSFYRGWTFPNELLHSNPGYAQEYAQLISRDIQRVSSTFTEPSVAACYLGGIFVYSLWRLLTGPTSAWMLVLSATSAVMLVLTTSTTGFIVLLLVFLILIGKLVFSRRWVNRLSLATALVMLLAVPLFFGVASQVSSIRFPYQEQISLLVESVGEKRTDLSFQQRSAADAQSITILADTYGVGAGFGSTRSSSFFTNMLGNTGVPGILLLVLFAARLVRVVKVARENHPSEDRAAPWGLGGALLGMLAAALVAVPDIINIFFWALLAALLGWCVRALADQSAGEPEHSGLPGAAPGPPALVG
jgi:hypothetical protein